LISYMGCGEPLLNYQEVVKIWLNLKTYIRM
jgi:adenine C2-methylase RlmN of 23S rRNA A2503 and tRNA A37